MRKTVLYDSNGVSMATRENIQFTQNKIYKIKCLHGLFKIGLIQINREMK